MYAICNQSGNPPHCFILTRHHHKQFTLKIVTASNESTKKALDFVLRTQIVQFFSKLDHNS